MEATSGLWSDPHAIETGEAAQCHQSPYRAGPHEPRLIEEEIERMLSLTVIQPSGSAWSSPVVLVPKQDGSTRFCVDYRKLNDLTVRDPFPLSRLDDTLHSIGNAQIFSTLDARWRFGNTNALRSPWENSFRDTSWVS
jgi:hypothetical protein